MGGARLELAYPKVPHFECGASTNSAIRPFSQVSPLYWIEQLWHSDFSFFTAISAPELRYRASAAQRADFNPQISLLLNTNERKGQKGDLEVNLTQNESEPIVVILQQQAECATRLYQPGAIGFAELINFANGGRSQGIDRGRIHLK